MQYVRNLLLSICLLIVNPISANVQYHFYFTSPLQQERFQHLVSEFRCVVCQNQSLAESNAPLALDLKKEIYTMVLTNTPDAQIKRYLVSRYGEYILFNPELNKVTFLLWLGPVIFLVGASLIMFMSIRRSQRQCDGYHPRI